MFNRVCLAFVASLVSFGAYAADYPTKAPQLAVWDWSGFYLGGSFGWSRQPMSTTGGINAKLDPTGWYGCGQAGYDHQFRSGIVAGIVSDICAGDVSGSSTFGGVAVPAKADIFGTLRGKLGYSVSLLNHPFLPYFTGGLAWSRNNLTAMGFKAQDTQLGYTFGGGIETALTQNIFVGVEYLYAGFGQGTYTFAPGFSVPINVTDQRVNIFANYRF